MAAKAELTPRALLSGVVLGALLTPCNVYSGLKIGWSFNMSIIALLLAFGFWRSLEKLTGTSAWGLKESNITQTTASAAASIISSGLVAPIPAYSLMTGEQLAPLPLMAWLFSVSFLGIWVAWYLRPALIETRPLPFPAGMATLETMKDIFSHGREAALHLAVLTGAGLASGLLKALQLFVWTTVKWSPLPVLKKFTFGLEPSLLLLGFGAIIGIRVGWSLLLGALLAWAGLAPLSIELGWVEVPACSECSLFASLVAWLLWPGVSLMVASTLTTLTVRLIRQSGRPDTGSRRPRTLAPGATAGFLLAGLLAVTLQRLLFDISLPLALLSIPLAVALAAVAARVVGETGIPPIGAIGKMSQLGFGVLAPGQATTNLMTANIAGGAAGQSADLLNDFKVGHAIHASPSKQALAQCFGIAAGSITGTLAYLLLIPDPAAMLLSEQWPAPAVATWKAVAEALAHGLDSLPSATVTAMCLSAAAGIVLGLLESLSAPARRRYLPSAAAMGLAFVIPASIALMLFCGAFAAWLLAARHPSLSARFTVAAAAGLIAGESIVGVAASFWDLAF